MSNSDIKKVEVTEKLSERELCPDGLLRGQEEAFARDIERLQQKRDDFITADCPACGGTESITAFEKHSFHYQSCAMCETIYMNPRPSPEVMASYYDNSENYAYWAKHIFPASEDSRREKIAKPWLQRVLDFCEQFKIDTDVLIEIGPGFGTWSELALASGRFQQVIAVERTPEMAIACRGRGITVVEKPIEDITDELPPADVLVAFEVIEHLFDPREFIGHCARLLRPGGLLVLSCPNGLGFDVSVLGRESLTVDPEHVNLFNPKSLSLLVEGLGFAVRDLSTPGRLDAEFVRTAIEDGRLDVGNQPFLKRVLHDEWDRLGWPFQQFLAKYGLSSHMWLAAQKQ